MRIIPVLDIQRGLVVRGVGGQREAYRPIVSRLTVSSLPVSVADAFREHFGLTELYVADLDAIRGAAPALETYATLRARGFQLWVDAGIRDVAQADPLAAAGIETIVAGLETLSGPESLGALCRQLGSARIAFSLDLKGGIPLGNTSAWGTPDAWSIAVRAINEGVRRLIVLDLARVGMMGGLGTEDLCARLHTAYPEVAVVAGGGIRDRSDLERLQQAGAAGMLVASALHDGQIRAEDLAVLIKPRP